MCRAVVFLQKVSSNCVSRNRNSSSSPPLVGTMKDKTTKYKTQIVYTIKTLFFVEIIKVLIVLSQLAKSLINFGSKFQNVVKLKKTVCWMIDIWRSFMMGNFHITFKQYYVSVENIKMVLFEQDFDKFDFKISWIV